MFGILVSALNTVLGFLLKEATMKALLFMGFGYVISLLVGYLGDLLPDMNQLKAAFGSIPGSIWFFMDLMAFTVGFPMVVAAVATRFLIRRMPVIG